MRKAIIVGRMVKPCEVKVALSGNKYGFITVAVDNGKDKGGNKKEPTYFNCLLSGGTAEFAAAWCGKGTWVVVEGEIEIERTKKEDGSYSERTTIINCSLGKCENKSRASEASDPDNASYSAMGADASYDLPAYTGNLDRDDLPF